MSSLLFVFALMFQADGSEAGKPASCDNYHSSDPAHRCECSKATHDKCDQPDPDVAMDQKCKTYCREQHCHCVSGCQTHMRSRKKAA